MLSDDFAVCEYFSSQKWLLCVGLHFMCEKKKWGGLGGWGQNREGLITDNNNNNNKSTGSGISNHLLICYHAFCSRVKMLISLGLCKHTL